jgi:hypothetical protein
MARWLREVNDPVPSLPGPQPLQLPRSKGGWTIGLIGRRKSLREAVIREALRGEQAGVTFAVYATAGLTRTSSTRFGDHAIALVTPSRLLVVVVNYQSRLVFNPVVLLASLIAHAIGPVRRPYVLLEAPLRSVRAETRDGRANIDVDVEVPEGGWVLRFERAEDASLFVRRASEGR